jgi:hypothetical protein
MGPDFSGYLTKYGIKCTDGRTIKQFAFQSSNGTQVPLVWQHQHDAPGNVLGYLQLIHKDDGVRADGYFNDTEAGQNAKKLVIHKDIVALSVYANQLVQNGLEVVHGMIREGSLVLAGANPGAAIDFINISHGDGDFVVSEDEAVIYSGEDIEIGDQPAVVHQATVTTTTTTNDTTPPLAQAVSGTDLAVSAAAPVAQATPSSGDGGPSVNDVINSLTPQQREVVYALIGAAMSQSDTEPDQSAVQADQKGDAQVSRNVFDQTGDGNAAAGPVLTHADVKAIFTSAHKQGSLKQAVEEWALAHSIQNIDLLFPDAQTVGDGTPDWISRRQAWVAGVLGGTRHTPFTRIKSLFADITLDEARARGYVKGALKREEFFGLTKRVTTPQTVYKKQKLDRDDILDITDFDVVQWLKTEMRVMLDEEIARAILIGDGRDVADPDKINEANIRPILTDAELYVTKVNINLSDASSTNEEIVDGVMSAMQFFQGTGVPTLYTARSWITKMLLTKDTLGRRLHSSITELADAMGVGSIVPVDVFESMTGSLIGIIVNLQDYAVGTDRGGEVTFFDDFDIDYNQFKYLYETRLSGALIKYKAALVVSLTNLIMLANPTSPTFVKATGVVTIPTMANVTYVSVNDTTGAESAALTAGPQSAIAAGAQVHIRAKPAGTHSFADNASNNWTFQRPAA